MAMDPSLDGDTLSLSSNLSHNQPSLLGKRMSSYVASTLLSKDEVPLDETRFVEKKASKINFDPGEKGSIASGVNPFLQGQSRQFYPALYKGKRSDHVVAVTRDKRSDQVVAASRVEVGGEKSVTRSERDREGIDLLTESFTILAVSMIETNSVRSSKRFIWLPLAPMFWSRPGPATPSLRLATKRTVRSTG